MNGVLLLLLTPIHGAEALSSDLPTEISIRAEEAYHAGLGARDDVKKAQPLFRQAAADYERLWQLGIRNRLVARNMAQAYFLSGDLGHSIRAYRLGLRLAPYDKELQFGLAFMRERVPYPLLGNLAESCRPRERASLLHLASTDAIKGIAACLYLIAFVAFARAWMTRRPLWWTFGGFSLMAAIAVMGGLIREEIRQADDDRLPLVIVVENNTPLHRGNASEYPLRLGDRLPAGVELRVLGERGGWLQVQLAGGEIGWLEREQVVAVE